MIGQIPNISAQFPTPAPDPLNPPTPPAPLPRRRRPRRVSPNALYLPDHRATAAERHRDYSDLVRRRAEALSAEDRALLKAFIDDGATCTDLARIAGITRGRMRRRLTNLITRVLSDDFRFVQSRLAAWGQIRRAVATVHFLQGRSFRETAAALGLSLHRVRAHIADIRAQMDAERDPLATPHPHHPEPEGRPR